MKVLIGGRELPVQITRKKMKNITLRVSKEGEIRISCPWYAQPSEIMNLIYANEAWILDQQLRRQKENTINTEGTSGSEIYWLGEAKQVSYRQGRQDRFRIDGDMALFTLKEKSDERIEKAFRREANRTILDLAKERRAVWDELICRANGLKEPEITMRYMTSKWGVCYTRKAKITLSTRLIHYPVECMEYVLLHEYTHFLVPNHSSRFYAIVERYMPDYRQRKKLMK